MNRLIEKTLLAAAIAGALAVPASAHHSAAQFDFANQVLIDGKVVSARFANPHMRLILEVTDDERGTREIEYEGHSRNNMYREGFRPEMFEAGDEIQIQIAPMRSGADGGYVTALVTPDGTQIGNISAAD